MSRTLQSASVLLAIALCGGSAAMANQASGKKQEGPPPAKKPTAPSAADQAMPGGMTPEQMQAMMAAATPGPMHKHLARGVGTWAGKVSMWMPGMPDAMKSECVTVITPMMDGRFTKSETTGEMAGGMGAFTGFGLYGFDNVSKKFQSTWLDNMGTGMMTGTGELAADGKTINWAMDYNCPITQKPAVMREVEHWTDDNTMTLTMFGPDPTTGKEMKVMEIAYTRKAPATPTSTGSAAGTGAKAPAAPSAPSAPTAPSAPRAPAAPKAPSAPAGR